MAVFRRVRFFLAGVVVVLFSGFGTAQVQLSGFSYTLYESLVSDPLTSGALVLIGFGIGFVLGYILHSSRKRHRYIRVDN